MSPNSDNAMARFLFAILKQKNLKDIDWNQVAQDPVLLQPISNGHAARMRYSRFRATVTNTEGRSSTKSKSNDKSRVSKPKARRDGSMGSTSSNSHIKQEYSHAGSLAHYSPASTTSPYLSDNARFLTPCSDDMGTINPAAVEDMSRPPPHGFSPHLDFMNPAAHMHSPTFSAFDDAAFDMADFTTETQPTQQHLEDCHPDWNDRLQPSF